MSNPHHLSPNSINEFLEDHHRSSSRDRRLFENGASFDQALPTPRHSHTRAAAIVVPGRPYNPAPARNRRTSTATVASSSTGMSSMSDASSWPDSYYNSSYSASVYTELTIPSTTGTVQPPRRGAYRLPCEFVGYASCDQYFYPEEADQWIEHIIVDHLRNHLPSKSACWYCDDHDFDASRDGDRMTHFRNRLDHIRTHIRDEGLGVDDIRPDYAFIAHIEKLGLIAQPVFQEAQSWQEGPVSGVTGIYAHDWEPPERQQQYGQSQAVVINEKSRGRKSNKHSDGHRRKDRTHGASQWKP
ncbi:hypothetical protein E8E14_000554 [Neopestalotiopsis sp. 37M]|nr:hypothetical protein E8E14_000554 [Neopestalotiopsis sp. 37M]